MLGKAILEDRTVLSLGDEQLDHLNEYAEAFADLFPRTNQFRSFILYLRGLMRGDHRKNFESIAESVRGPHDSGKDLAQSLQHFVSRSPWSADRLFARYRDIVASSLTHSRGTLVVHDAMFQKTGKHSAGVQRQFSRSLGRKVNCQLAVVVSFLCESGYWPLAAKLYLPASWVRENPELVERTIPKPEQAALTKPDIAIALIDELVAEGWTDFPIAAEEGYTQVHSFIEGIQSRKLTLAPLQASPKSVLNIALSRFDWLKEHLGLDHFEGRTWVGWHHHVSIVFAAYGFMARETQSDQLPPFPPRASEDWSI